LGTGIEKEKDEEEEEDVKEEENEESVEDVSANVPHERQMRVCVIERFFCTGVRNTHQKSLRMRGFLGKLFVRQKLVPTGSPIRRHPARRIDGPVLSPK
jgi:hypothetical protein